MIKTILITSGNGTFTVPNDFASLIAIHAIGAGTTGYTYRNVNSNDGLLDSYIVLGGSGGAYAKTDLPVLYPGATCYYNVSSALGTASLVYHSPQPYTRYPQYDTWFNAVANTYPTSASHGVLAQKANSNSMNEFASYPGLAADCIGTVAYNGGYANLAGGGAAGPGGPGGGIGIITIGGFGGTEPGFLAGGGSGYGTAGTALSINAGNAPSGTGGGGGAGGYSGADSESDLTNNALYGTNGNGSMLNIWNGSVYPDISGSGTWAGPGGGGGSNTHDTQIFIAPGEYNVVLSGHIGGNGSVYGGGAGGSAIGTPTAGDGLIVFTYVSPVVVGNGIFIPGQVKFS